MWIKIINIYESLKTGVKSTCNFVMTSLKLFLPKTGI